MKKIFLILVVAVFLVSGCQFKLTPPLTSKILNPEEAKAKALTFINANLVAPGNEVTIKEIIQENGLYKLKIAFKDGKEIDSYLTRDGSNFFPEAIPLVTPSTTPETTDTAATAPTPAIVSVKADKPKVELFVMSQCPYGTQVEKGILPVVELLGNKMEFDLKFVNYAMHGKTELDEQLNQYCLKTGEPTKFISYLKCFLVDGDGARCLTDVKANTSKLKSCVAKTDKTYSISAGYADKSTWTGSQCPDGPSCFPQFNISKEDNTKYGVQGSPTLIINGTNVETGRDSQSLLTTICSAFNTPPAECSQTLSSETPAPGFGAGTTASAAAADCAQPQQ